MCEFFIFVFDKINRPFMINVFCYCNLLLLMYQWLSLIIKRRS